MAGEAPEPRTGQPAAALVVVGGRKECDAWHVVLLTQGGEVAALTPAEARQLAQRIGDMADLVERGPEL